MVVTDRGRSPKIKKADEFGGLIRSALSIAATSGRWLRRKLHQVGGTLGGHGIHNFLPSLSSLPRGRAAHPQWVGSAHSADQITDFWTDPGPSRMTGWQREISLASGKRG